jgi:SAM-dependent methyltransferase
MPLPSPAHVFAKLRSQGVRACLHYAVHRVHAEYWERRLGVRTSGGYLLVSEGVVNKDDHDYSPESYLDFQRAMRWLSPDELHGVFMDCGSGKGRIVLRAACYPFRCAIGVELSPTLNAIATRNLEAARSRLACRDVQFVTTDATAYEFPADLTCLFLYNPFGGAVVDTVLENLHRSLEKTPRALALIVSTPDRVERALANARWIAKAGEFIGLRRHILYRTA